MRMKEDMNIAICTSITGQNVQTQQIFDFIFSWVPECHFATRFFIINFSMEDFASDHRGVMLRCKVSFLSNNNYSEAGLHLCAL
jgi:hypothetical protein